MKTSAYKITITEAYRAEECGVGYSFTRWGEDTADYKGYDEKIEVEIPNHWKLGRTTMGELCLFENGEGGGVTLNDAIQMGIAKVIE